MRPLRSRKVKIKRQSGGKIRALWGGVQTVHLAGANLHAAADSLARMAGGGDRVSEKTHIDTPDAGMSTVVFRYLRKNRESMGKPNSGSIRVAVLVYPDGAFIVRRIGRWEKSRLGAFVAGANFAQRKAERREAAKRARAANEQ